MYIETTRNANGLRTFINTYLHGGAPNAHSAAAIHPQTRAEDVRPVGLAEFTGMFLRGNAEMPATEARGVVATQRSIAAKDTRPAGLAEFLGMLLHDRAVAVGE